MMRGLFAAWRVATAGEPCVAHAGIGQPARQDTHEKPPDARPVRGLARAAVGRAARSRPVSRSFAVGGTGFEPATPGL